MSGLIASSFVTVVGLLAQFLGSVESRKKQTVEEYLEWLRRRDQSQLADSISSNTELVAGIQSLLSNQHSEVVSKLDELSKILTFVASRFVDFTPMADAVGAESLLSDQALSILQQMNAASASKLILVRTLGGTLGLMGGATFGQRQITIADQRFLDSDLQDLVDYGLLLERINSKGDTFYVISRAGSKVGECVPAEDGSNGQG